MYQIFIPSKKRIDPFIKGAYEVLLDPEDDYTFTNFIVSPEYHASTGIIVLQGIDSSKNYYRIIDAIHFAADGLMKNLVFRNMDVPLDAWLLLECKGTISNQYSRCIHKVYPDIPTEIQEFIDLYKKCEVVQPSGPSNLGYALYDVVKDSYEAFVQLLELYKKIATPESKKYLYIALEADNTLEVTRNQDYKVKLNYNRVQYWDEFYHDVKINETIIEPYFAELTLPTFPSRDNFLNREHYSAAVVNGAVVPFGTNHTNSNFFMESLLAKLDIIKYIQSGANINIEKLFKMYMYVSDCSYRFNALVTGFSGDVPMDKKLSDMRYFIQMVEEEDYYQYSDYIIPYTDEALAALYKIDNLSDDEICEAGYAISCAIESMDEDWESDENPDRLRHMLSAIDFLPPTILDKALDYAFDGDYYKLIDSATFEVPKFSLFPSKNAIDWYNSLN